MEIYMIYLRINNSLTVFGFCLSACLFICYSLSLSLSPYMKRGSLNFDKWPDITCALTRAWTWGWDMEPSLHLTGLAFHLLPPLTFGVIDLPSPSLTLLDHKVDQEKIMPPVRVCILTYELRPIANVHLRDGWTKTMTTVTTMTTIAVPVMSYGEKGECGMKDSIRACRYSFGS